MFKDAGRLDLRIVRDTEEKIQKIFQDISKDKLTLAKNNIVKLLDTPNFFIREFVGKKLVSCPDEEKMNQIISDLIGHKTYGVRAAIIFYYYIKYDNNPKKIFDLLEECWNDTPWETEHILHQLWQKQPELMKQRMLGWAESEHVKQKALAYHGIEAIGSSDPIYVLKIIEKNLDEPNLELQKKISNILSHVVQARPAEAYSFFREWLTIPSESRIKTIFLTMKRLISIASQARTNKTEDFYVLTMQSIKDWKVDPVKSVSAVGEKLVSFSKNPAFNEQD